MSGYLDVRKNIGTSDCDAHWEFDHKTLFDRGHKWNLHNYSD